MSGDLILVLLRVLARPKRQGAAPCRFVQRPVVFPQRPVVFSVPCHFPRALWFLQAFISVILSLKLQKVFTLRGERVKAKGIIF